MSKGKRPVYWLKITDKDNTKNRTFAGAAWVSEYNQLRIVLNPGVRIDWKDEVWITLEPIDPDHPPRLPKVLRVDEDESTSSEKKGDDDDSASDISF